MTTITISSLCDGLGHWCVDVVDGATSHRVQVEWSELQAPLDAADLDALARLVLRARCAGQPIEALGDLMLNGITL